MLHEPGFDELHKQNEIDGGEEEDCPRCRGRGYLEQVPPSDPFRPPQCPDCEGSGRADRP